MPSQGLRRIECGDRVRINFGRWLPLCWQCWRQLRNPPVVQDHSPFCYECGNHVNGNRLDHSNHQQLLCDKCNGVGCSQSLPNPGPDILSEHVCVGTLAELGGRMGPLTRILPPRIRFAITPTFGLSETQDVKTRALARTSGNCVSGEY